VLDFFNETLLEELIKPLLWNPGRQSFAASNKVTMLSIAFPGRNLGAGMVFRVLYGTIERWEEIHCSKLEYTIQL